MTVTIYAGGAQVDVIAQTAQPSTPPPPPSSPDLSFYTSKAARSISNVGAAVLQALNPWPTITPAAPSGANGDSIMGFAGILAASGMVFLPWLGRSGTLVVYGGGHNDYCGNDIYAFDCYAQSWSQWKAPRWPLFKDAAGYHAGNDGEHWADATATTTLQDERCTGHNYGLSVALQPDANFPQGAILIGCVPVMTVPGQRSGMRSHVFDIATKKWSRYASNLVPAGFEFAGAFIDKKRNRYVMPLLGKMGLLDLTTRAWSTLGSNYATGVTYMMWQHYEAADLYVGLQRYGTTTRLWVVDPVTGAQSSPGVSAGWPAAAVAGGGACWSELLGGIAFYYGQGESDVLLVKPPASNPKTTPWDVSTITFSGDTPAKDTVVGAGSHCRRFVEHKDAGGFLWLGNTQAPVQFFKV